MKKQPVVFDFPLPPQTNGFVGETFRTWLKLASNVVGKTDYEPLVCPVRIRAIVGLGDRRRNLIRATERAIDVLVAEGVIGGNSVCDLDLRFDRTVAPWRMRVELKPVRAPESRLPASARAKVAQARRARAQVNTLEHAC